jgi:hypothetical protein
VLARGIGQSEAHTYRLTVVCCSEILDLLALRGVYTYQFHQGARLHREDQRLAYKYSKGPSPRDPYSQITITDEAQYNPAVHRRYLEPKIWKGGQHDKKMRIDAMFWDCAAAIVFSVISMRTVVVSRASNAASWVIGVQCRPLRSLSKCSIRQCSIIMNRSNCRSGSTFACGDIRNTDGACTFICHGWLILTGAAGSMRTLMRDGRAAAAAALGCAILCAYGLLYLNSMLHAVVGQSFGVACMACWLGLLLLLALAARIPAHIHLVAVLSDRASQVERLCYRYTVGQFSLLAQQQLF